MARPVFATLLRQHRVAAGLSQEELAERAGLSARAISDLERGLRRAPHRPTVALLAAALGLAQAEQAEFKGSVNRLRGRPAITPPAATGGASTPRPTCPRR
jgi:transcriptional regulator with XRE-family HTH domain